MMSQPVPLLAEQDRVALARARHHLEHPSLAARLTAVVGTPIEVGFRLLPKGWYDRLHGGVERALVKALDTAVSTMGQGRDGRGQELHHKLLCAGTGATGGLLGLPGLLIELPLTTTLMLRGIADVARLNGEDLTSPEARLACVTVFAYGARSEDDDAADTGYYGIRLALALAVSNAARHIAAHGLHSGTAPWLARLVSLVASRFGAGMSQKVAAQLVPVVGAVGGAAVNTIFMQHYLDVGRAHFTVRRLERRYGEDLIRAEYERLGTGSGPA